MENELLSVQALIVFAIKDVNNRLQEVNASFQLYTEQYRVIKIIPNNDKYIHHISIDLDVDGKNMIIHEFKKYGLLPIFYDNSIGVEIDND